MAQISLLPLRVLTNAICVRGDARHAAGKPRDDFVGKLVRELARLRFGGLP